MAQLGRAWAELPAIYEGEKMLRTLFSATILAGALAGSAMAQAPDAACALPSEPKDIPAALDAAITGPVDKDRACDSSQQQKCLLKASGTAEDITRARKSSRKEAS